MTATSVRRPSLLRLIWATTMPEGLVFLAPAMALLSFQAWLASRSATHTLGYLAYEFQGPVFFLGLSLLNAGLIADPDGSPQWAIRVGQWGRRRRSFSLLDLKPVAESATASEAPGTVAVVQPMLAGVGAACLGFAFGLNVIVAFSHDQFWSPPRVVSIFMCACIAFVAAVAVYRVTGSTRRLFVWSQEVAASASTAEAAADRARIGALQAQMNPHFLFNALNTVASLLGSDGARARATVQNLSGMLQHTLQRSATPLTTVEDELQFVRDYLDIERERFGSRLRVTYDIDPSVSAMAVPTMSLQPLVENVIKHAVTNRLEGGLVRIAAGRRVDPPRLVLSVEDDGPGFMPGSGDGTGLGNLRARLRSLYGPAAELTTETLPTGARVSFTIQAPPNPTNLKNPRNLSNQKNPPHPS